MNQLRFVTSGYKIDVTPYWKDILRIYLNNPVGLKFSSAIKDCETSEEFINDRDSEVLQFANDVGYDEEVKRVIHLITSDEEETLYAIKYYSRQMFFLLAEWGYLNSNEEVDELHSVKYTHWRLTEKGIEVALKLQEHSDNERRHNTTSNYSKSALFVSIGALVIAAISAWFNYQRLDLYEKEILKNTQEIQQLINHPNPKNS